jgi:MinD-like ATPase involved in chromosome partitioning or flagellar assembly
VDVYRGRRPLASAISRGSHGLRVVGNLAGTTHGSRPTEDEIATLSDEISKLGQEADLVVVDAGWGDSPVARRMAQDADFVLLATTTSDAAVMEAYASIKRMTSAGVTAKIAVIVSRAGNLAEAENAFGRLSQGCRRFLGLSADWAGCVLNDSTVADGVVLPPVILPRCEAAKGIQQTAEYGRAYWQ